MKKKLSSRYWLLSILMGAMILQSALFSGSIASADEVDSIYTDEVQMVVGELEIVKVYSLTRLSIAKPGIADIVNASDSEILLIAKGIGSTPLFIWDENGKRTMMIHVGVNHLEQVKSRIETLLKTTGIEEVNLSINAQEGKVVISGEVPKDKMGDLAKIIEPFGKDVLPLFKEELIEDLIQIDVQITELNETLQKSLGIDWSAGGRTGISPNYSETVPNFDGSIGDFFKIGDFTRTGQLVAAVNALITEGKGRILSKPKLVVVSGNEAEFLVGGEVPIRTTTFSQSGSSQENVEFKKFGVEMTVTPEIRRRGKIDMEVQVTVSEVDASTASSVSEDVAFSSREAKTQLLLDDGQTIVIAGLIKQNTSDSVSRIPFVSKIPLVGLLFTNRSNPVASLDQELVISLTPHRLTHNDGFESKQAKTAAKTRQASGAMETVEQEETRPIAKNITSTVKSYDRLSKSSFSIPVEMTGYVKHVQSKIAEAFIYPPEAEEYGWEGTVKVGLHILSDGTLAFASITESSGFEVFDEYALNTAKEISPYSSFPPNTDLEELNVVIPIVYSLERN